MIVWYRDLNTGKWYRTNGPVPDDGELIETPDGGRKCADVWARFPEGEEPERQFNLSSTVVDPLITLTEEDRVDGPG